MPERRRNRGGLAAIALGVALAASVAVAPVVAAGCGGDADGEASETTTVTETAGETATDTAGQEGMTTPAPPPAAPPGRVARFRGKGDRILGVVHVGRGGGTITWQNDDAVFSLFSDYGVVVDSVERRGEASLQAGRRVLEVIASGGWSIEISNARRAR